VEREIDAGSSRLVLAAAHRTAAMRRGTALGAVRICVSCWKGVQQMVDMPNKNDFLDGRTQGPAVRRLTAGRSPQSTPHSNHRRSSHPQGGKACWKDDGRVGEGEQ
jgi:hypothetical protein